MTYQIFAEFLEVPYFTGVSKDLKMSKYEFLNTKYEFLNTFFSFKYEFLNTFCVF